MTAHELARKLLEMEDKEVTYSVYNAESDGIEIYNISVIDKYDDSIELIGEMIGGRNIEWPDDEEED